ncbi:MAG: (2Fe-2S)-binding protein [Verrucomicrobia bacterium]|jgi:[NiFe] hydrogenase diaphorase moiety small subunit|nr:(2Fe-2S)-binding protein [Verrucomicrobiota bacterium]OQC67430.1 MAG: NAD-reducing hydrogenase HoxS subunit gamma [Verrucomicrobia bacterium ADurb.Bin006]MDI9380159.1 2Fe-2S iron-sulfur cluster-binding protein [Verrucomicrobiota bacterium]NMD21373.1 2Fe-2S iron-sulfur cluster binding domain-containing protein [Verrucomicrobiota bacterium]HNU99916.1 2Fe-2S iron-sulfur cluster-binding protein [Verrucomicrobiota bacterium]
MSNVTFTIDGREVSGRAGQTILKAAEASGIYIPRLCAYKNLVPHGSCRVCSVRVNGRIQAACVQTISDGMVVENDSAEIREFRTAILDMLFVEGNHYCMFCEKSGLCELQALAYRFGITAPQYPFLNPDRPVDLSHPDVYLDHNRCILCGRCVRVSQELDHKNVFQFVDRGYRKRLQVNGEALAATRLAVTDEVTASCPTGALMRKRVGYAVPIGQRPFDAQPIGAGNLQTEDSP